MLRGATAIVLFVYVLLVAPAARRMKGTRFPMDVVADATRPPRATG